MLDYAFIFIIWGLSIQGFGHDPPNSHFNLQYDGDRFYSVCALSKVLEKRDSISQRDIDSLLALLRRYRIICTRDGATERLFHRWVELGYSDERFFKFFLNLSDIVLNNIEFSEGTYEYVLRIALRRPDFAIRFLSDDENHLRDVFLECLRRYLSIVSTWNSRTFEAKQNDFREFVFDICLGETIENVRQGGEVAALDSIAEYNKQRFISIRDNFGNPR